MVKNARRSAVKACRRRAAKWLGCSVVLARRSRVGLSLVVRQLAADDPRLSSYGRTVERVLSYSNLLPTTQGCRTARQNLLPTQMLLDVQNIILWQRTLLTVDEDQRLSFYVGTTTASVNVMSFGHDGTLLFGYAFLVSSMLLCLVARFQKMLPVYRTILLLWIQ